MSVFAAAVVFSAVQDDCPQKLAGLLHPISAMLDLVRTHFSLQLQAFFDWSSLDYLLVCISSYNFGFVFTTLN